MSVAELRIGIVTPRWSGPDGAPTLPALQDLVREVARRHRVRVVALRYPPVAVPFVLDGAEVRSLAGGRAAGPLGRARLMGLAVRTLLQLDRRDPFDVLHALWADEPGAVCAIAGRLLRIPVLVSVLGGELSALGDIGYGAGLGLGGRGTARLALRAATEVTVGSQALFHQVALLVPDRPLRLAPLGVDLEAFRPPASSSTVGAPARLLWAGSLTPVKDPVLLLRAFARLQASLPLGSLDVVGDGPLRAGLERLAVELGVGEAVHFRGYLSRTDLAERYREADLLVVTSRHESQSMVAVEAAASGLPVVGPPVGVLPELAARGGGRVVPVGSPTALADALLGALGDPAGRARMGRAARLWAEKHADLAACVEGLDRTYHRLAGPG